MDPVLRARVVLGFSRRNYPVFIAHAQAVHDGISADPTRFPTPSVVLTLLAAQISDLRAAQQATVGHTGATKVRNAKAAIVAGSLETLANYVQTLSDAEPDQASVLAQAAGMKLVTTPARHKPELAASNGAASGRVLLAVNRTVLTGSLRKRTYISWQYSLDGKTWTAAPSTLLAKTEIDGLPVLTTVSFRASATPSKGEATAWTQAVSLLIR